MAISDLTRMFESLLPKAVPMPELVRKVQGGHSGTWQDGGRQADVLARTHDEISDRGLKALAVLESSWTGGGADAARAKLTPALKATVSASAAYQANARTVTDSAYAFDGLKSSLVPMPEAAPSRNAWDTLTPWDTDTEDQINQFRQLEEQNRQAYQAYERNMQASAQQLRRDYGTLDALDGDITLDQPGDTHGVATPKDSGTITFDEHGSSRGSVSSLAGTPSGIGSSVGTPSAIAGPMGTVSGTVPDFTSTPRPISESTSASSYQPPDPSLNRPAAYQPSTFGSGGGQNATTGAPWTAGGLGRIPAQSTGGFGPTGGRTGMPAGGGSAAGRINTPGLGGMSGSGSAGGAGGTGSGAGVAGPGRGSGAAPLGAGGTAGAQQPAAGSRTGGGAAAGRGAMPMGAMGGAGRGGQGGDDSEHRNNYVQATDEAFALTDGDEALRDPETGHVVTPPTIGG